MSNYLAVATVTATLKRLILNALGGEGIAGDVTTGRPRRTGDEDEGDAILGSGPIVNIFLYQVNPNPYWRNNDLPTRTGSGQTVQRPVAAVDAHYLFTFYGDEAALAPQRLLGVTLAALHGTPVLTREMITATKVNLGIDELAFLANSDLDEQIEQVKLTPHCFSLDEFSKLWSIFSQNAYALSVAFLASVLFIEGRETVETGLPVREGRIYATTFRQPYIETVRPESGSAIIPGSRVVVIGRNLSADLVRVRLGRQIVEPLAVSEQQIVVAIPPFSAQAGAQSVQVLHPLLLGDPATERPGAQSNAAAFMLSPVIRATSVDAAAETVDVTVDTPVRKGQQTRLLLARTAGQTYQLEPDAPAAPDTPQTVLVFDVSGVDPGTYLIRIQIDGAPSPLSTDINGNFNGPTVLIP